MNHLNSDISILKDLIVVFLQRGDFFKGKTRVKLILGKICNFSLSQYFSLGTNSWSIPRYKNSCFLNEFFLSKILLSKANKN